MATNFAVIFDNGGNITIQTHRWMHTYDGYRVRQAAHDTILLLAGDNPIRDGWDGNEMSEDGRMVYDPEVERNNGYNWCERAEVLNIIRDGRCDMTGAAAVEYWTALGVETPE